MTRATTNNIEALPYTVNSFHKTHGVLSVAFPTEGAARHHVSQQESLNDLHNTNDHYEIVHEPTGKVVYES